jgi:hypothetical protein
MLEMDVSELLSRTLLSSCSGEDSLESPLRILLLVLILVDVLTALLSDRSLPSLSQTCYKYPSLIFPSEWA